MKSLLSIHCGECRSHLLAFLHGDVSPLLRRQVARHLDHCPACYELYRQELDLMRDLKREVPFIGATHQPRFDLVWAAIQQDIVKPKSAMPRFHFRYGLAMMALVAGCGGESPSVDNQTTAMNEQSVDNSMGSDPSNPYGQAEMQMHERMIAAVGTDV